MGMLSDLFLYREDDIAALDLEESPLLADPRVEGAELKGLSGLQLMILWAAIEDRPWTIEEYRAKTRASPSYESMLEWFPPPMTKAFAGLSEPEIVRVAAALGGTEDFRGPWDAENLRWLLGVVRDLAQRADGRVLCLWTCL